MAEASSSPAAATAIAARVCSCQLGWKGAHVIFCAGEEVRVPADRFQKLIEDGWITPAEKRTAA